jgi:hypothetical protein
VDVGGVFVERVLPSNSNDIKQSRESAFPYPLVFVSLPSPTIVDPKVKFFRYRREVPKLKGGRKFLLVPLFCGSPED